MKVNTYTNACVNIEWYVIGEYDNNVFIISDTESVFAVDPSADANALIRVLDGRKLDGIVLTHRHSDHVDAAKKLRELTGAPTYAHPLDASVIEGREPLPHLNGEFDPCPVDVLVNDGDILNFGSMNWKVLHTPGHTEGHFCMLIDPKETDVPDGCPVLIGGDLVFCGSIGRTDFGGGDMSDMRSSLQRVSKLDKSTIILPGHGELTSVGLEENRVFAMYC